MKWMALVFICTLGLTAQSQGEKALRGYTALNGSVFLGIHMPTLRPEIIRVKTMRADHQAQLKACMNPPALQAVRAARVVVEYRSRYSSDMRTLDPRTFVPHGYEGVETVVTAVTCEPVGTAFLPLWQSFRKKLN